MPEVGEKVKVSAIGLRLRELRKEHNWTLTEITRRTGISVGTLSKLENGKTELNFSSVSKLAVGLNVPVTDLTSPGQAAKGRRAITTGGKGELFRTQDIDYEVLCSEVANQHQGYFKAVIKARKFDPDLPWHHHPGQEFLYVLSGSLELHTELYEPLLLKSGDSILFDSSMGHHYVSKGRKPAEILVSMSLEGYQNVADSFRPKRKNRS